MALVPYGILEESREYYRKRKRESVGRLLINPRGSLYRRKEGGSTFVYSRRFESGAKRHISIGRNDSPHTAVTIHGVALPGKAINALREAKAAMKELGMPSQAIKTEDYAPTVQELFHPLVDGLHKKWVKKLVASAGKAGADLDAANAVLRRAGIIEHGGFQVQSLLAAGVEADLSI